MERMRRGDKRVLDKQIRRVTASGGKVEFQTGKQGWRQAKERRDIGDFSRSYLCRTNVRFMNVINTTFSESVI